MRKLIILIALVGYMGLRVCAQTTFTEIVCNNGRNSNPQDMTEYNGKTYFSTGDSATGRELWVTDGTQAGTHVLKDINPGMGSSYPNGLQVYNGKLYFFARKSTGSGMDLYITDGTSSGTQIFKNFPNNSSGLENAIIFNNKFFFCINDTLDIFRLWVSDGTSSGTQLVMPYSKSSGCNNPDQLKIFNGKLYYTAMNTTYGRELWVTDGTVSGTKMVKDIYPGTLDGFPSNFVLFNNKMYFSARDASNGNELWETDGTTAGTVLVKDINAGSGDAYPSNFIVYNGSIYFQAAGNATSREELWVSDGTPGGTKLLKEINAAFASYPSQLFVYKNKIYFRANDGMKGDELWISDGTSAGTKLLKDINTGLKSSNIFGFTTLNDIMYFVACPDPNFKEYTIYESDGTDTGTKAIAPPGKTFGAPFDYQLFFDGFKNCNGSLCFTAWYNNDSIQLWYIKNKAPVSGINAPLNLKAEIYPNPSTGVLNILFHQPLSGILILKDVNGKIIFNLDFNHLKETQIDINNLARGLYILSIETNSGSNSWKVMKE